MPESASARVVFPVDDHIVVMIGTRPHGNSIKMKFVTNLPGNHVIGARRISAQAKSSHDLPLRAIEGEPAAEDYDAAN